MARWIGKKTREWERVRAKLKPKFEQAGITRCEFRFADCWGGHGLSFAHPRKRRNLEPSELEVCALACPPCHTILESMPEPIMYQAVMRVIEDRDIQPT